MKEQLEDLLTQPVSKPSAQNAVALAHFSLTSATPGPGGVGLPPAEAQELQQGSRGLACKPKTLITGLLKKKSVGSHYGGKKSECPKATCQIPQRPENNAQEMVKEALQAEEKLCHMNMWTYTKNRGETKW